MDHQVHQCRHVNVDSSGDYAASYHRAAVNKQKDMFSIVKFFIHAKNLVEVSQFGYVAVEKRMPLEALDAEFKLQTQSTEEVADVNEDDGSCTNISQNIYVWQPTKGLFGMQLFWSCKFFVTKIIS